MCVFQTERPNTALKCPPCQHGAVTTNRAMRSCRNAAACYEGLNGEVRLARRPLEVQFCKDAPDIASRQGRSPPGFITGVAPVPLSVSVRLCLRLLDLPEAACMADTYHDWDGPGSVELLSGWGCVCRPDCPPRLHVWVALFAESELRRDAVMHDLTEAGVPKPVSELRVGGAVPGAPSHLQLAANFYKILIPG